jgi:hypothetical protein
VSLRSIAKKYVGGLRQAGASEIDRRLLRKDLQELTRRQGLLLWVALGFCAVLFGVEVWLIIKLRTDPELLQKVFGGIGATAFGILCFVAKLNRDHGRNDLLWALVPHLAETDLRLVLKSVLNTGRIDLNGRE